MYLKKLLCTLQKCYVPNKNVMYLTKMLCTLQKCYVPYKIVMYLTKMLCTLQKCYVPYKNKSHWNNDTVMNLFIVWGTRWCSWLRHCTTSRKVAGSIPDGVIGPLWSIQPITEINTRSIS